jgi:iron-sulfur cluster assembly accessory protein
VGLLKIKRKGEKLPTANAVEEQISPLSRDVLGISDDAARHIEQLLSAKQNLALFLRVAIRGGGCSGLSIHYEFSDCRRVDDVVFTKDQAKVIIDPKSLRILGGATLHCRDYLGSKEFMLVNNPAQKQCSCGQSFAL